MVSVRDFPLVIDPASAAIEAMVCTDDKLDSFIWQQLSRVTEGVDRLPFTLVPSNAHVFGDNGDLAKCRYLLVYACTGRISTVWTYVGNNEWVPLELAPESTGGAPLHPSVRFVFQNTVDQHRFMSLITTMSEQVRNQQAVSPRDATELLLIIGRAPERPRVLYVEGLTHVGSG